MPRNYFNNNKKKEEESQIGSSSSAITPQQSNAQKPKDTSWKTRVNTLGGSTPTASQRNSAQPKQAAPYQTTFNLVNEFAAGARQAAKTGNYDVNAWNKQLVDISNFVKENEKSYSKPFLANIKSTLEDAFFTINPKRIETPGYDRWVPIGRQQNMDVGISSDDMLKERNRIRNPKMERGYRLEQGKPIVTDLADLNAKNRTAPDITSPLQRQYGTPFLNITPTDRVMQNEQALKDLNYYASKPGASLDQYNERQLKGINNMNDYTLNRDSYRELQRAGLNFNQAKEYLGLQSDDEKRTYLQGRGMSDETINSLVQLQHKDPSDYMALQEDGYAPDQAVAEMKMNQPGKDDAVQYEGTVNLDDYDLTEDEKDRIISLKDDAVGLEAELKRTPLSEYEINQILSGGTAITRGAEEGTEKPAETSIEAPDYTKEQNDDNRNIYGATNRINQELDNRDFLKRTVLLMQNEDFEENSKLPVLKDEWIPSYTDDDARAMMTDEDLEGLLIASISGNKKAYDFLHYDVSNYGLKNEMGSILSKYIGQDEGFMTDEERSIFGYIYNTQGKEAALEYFRELDDRYLKARASEDLNEQWREYAQNLPVSASILSVGLKPVTAVASGVSELVDLITTGHINANDPKYASFNMPNTLRAAVSESITDATGSTELGKLYDVGMSVLDNLYGVGVSGKIASTLGVVGEGANTFMEAYTLGIMGTDVAQATTLENIRNGMNEEDAILSGFVAGAIEVITEKIGLDNLFNSMFMGKDKWITSMLKQMGSEGAEEGLSDVMNWAWGAVYDNFTGRDQSDWRRKMNAYIIENGLAPDQQQEAFAAVFQEQMTELAYDVGGGFVSGLPMSGYGVVRDNMVYQDALAPYYTDVNGKRFDLKGMDTPSIQMMAEEAMQYPDNTQAHKKAENILIALGSGQNVSQRAVESLYRELIKIDAGMTPGTAKAPLDLSETYDLSVQTAEKFYRRQQQNETINAAIEEAIGNYGNPNTIPSEIRHYVEDSAPISQELMDSLSKGTLLSLTQIAEERAQEKNERINTEQEQAEEEQPNYRIPTEEQTEEQIPNRIRTEEEEYNLTESGEPAGGLVARIAANYADNGRPAIAETLQGMNQNGMIPDDLYVEEMMAVYDAVSLGQIRTDKDGKIILPKTQHLTNEMIMGAMYAAQQDQMRLNARAVAAEEETLNQQAEEETEEYNEQIENEEIPEQPAELDKTEEQIEADYDTLYDYAGRASESNANIFGKAVSDNYTESMDVQAYLDGADAIYQQAADGVKRNAIAIPAESRQYITRAVQNAIYEAAQEDIKGGATYVRNISLSGSSERLNSPSTTVQSQGVAGRAGSAARTGRITEGYRGTEEAYRRENEGNVTGRAAASNGRYSYHPTGQVATAKSLGLSTGTDQFRVQIVELDDTPEGREVMDIAKSNGKKLVLFAGNNLSFEGQKSGSNGVIQGDTIYVRADHPAFSPAQIALHEVTHPYFETNANSKINAIAARLDALFGENFVKGQVLPAYRQAYKRTESGDLGTLIEIMCDVRGGMNIFHSMQALLPATQENYDQFLTEGQKIVSEAVQEAEQTAKQNNAPPAEFSRETEQIQNDLNDKGVYYTGDMAVRFSQETWNDTDIDALKSRLSDAGFEENEIDKWIDDVNSIASIILGDRARLDYDADAFQVALKSNSEYYFTLDLSTLCKKRQLYQGTYNAIMHALQDKALLPEDVIKLRKMMADMGYEVPCGICYEESRKKNEGKFAARWLNGYGKRWRGYKNMEHTDPYIPTLAQVTTTDGRAWLRENHPEALESYLQYQKTRGSANPKVSMTHTEYRGDILRMTDNDVANVKHIGGLRLQSFSDFETVHVIDLMQAVMDMASRNLTAQAYTKVPAFADIFGGTGIKINLSLIGKVNENGKLEFDAKEGMDPKEAFRLRKKYSDNVGTILVGANDASILAAWADPRIDMVIPFHRSGWSKAEFDNLGLTGYKDFTRGQTERYLNGKKDMALSTASKMLGLKGENALRGIYAEDYWDYSKSGKENAEAYLQLCAEKHYRPVFYQFLHDNGDGTWSLQADGSTDGYWKSLVDFKMYNNEGKGARQTEVTPNFDMDAAKATMDAFDGNPNTLPVAQDVVDKFVAEYGGTNFSQELDAEYMDAVNRGDMDTAQRMVDERANEYLNDLLLPNDDDEKGFKYHRGPAPTKTFKRYAVLNVSPDGFRAAYAGNKNPTPIGVWLDSQNLDSYMSDQTQFADGSFATYIIGDTGAAAKEKFSPELLEQYGLKPSSKILLERGGKHSSDVPNFSQMNLKQDENGNKVTNAKRDGALPHNKLIFEIEYGISDDGDLTEYVKEHGRIDATGKNQGLAKIQPNQYYDFKTNPNAVGKWGIGGTFRITRLVPYSEVVSVTEQYKKDAIAEAEGLYAKGKISKADMNKQIKNAEAIQVQKWVGGYHPEDSGLTVENVREMVETGQKMKLTDPVTYDDNGNVIPLSERFNMEKQDIRFSEELDPQIHFDSLYTTLEDGRIKPTNIDALTTEDWKLIYKAVNKLGYGMRSVKDTREVYQYTADAGFNADQSAAIKAAYGVTNESKVAANPAREALAAKTFGLTTNFSEAGYLMRNGKMLDFSGKRDGGPSGVRYMDHREIQEVFGDNELPEEKTRYSNTPYMDAFISEGNIRLMDGQGVTVGEMEPTSQQYAMLKQFVNYVLKDQNYFYLDISSNDGEPLANRDYSSSDGANKIINDIKAYYKNGELPYRSSLSAFYSQEVDPDAHFDKNMESIAKDLRKRVRQLERENRNLQRNYEYSQAQSELTAYTPESKAWRDMKSIISEKDAGAIAKDIIQTYSSTIKADEITADIQYWTTYLHTGRSNAFDRINRGLLGVARKIVENASVIIDHDGSDILRDIKQTKIKISPKVAGDIQDYNAWRKKYFGKMTVSTTSGVDITEYYNELNDRFGSLFPEDVNNATDQLLYLADFVDSFVPESQNPYSYDMAAATQAAALDLYNALVDAPVAEPTQADVQAGEAISRVQKKADASRQKALESAKKRTDRRIERMREQNKKRMQNLQRRSMEIRDRQINALKDHYREQAQNRRIRKEESDARKQLLHLVQRLNRIKTTKANRMLIDELIGNLDSVAMSLSAGKATSLLELQEWYESEKENNPDFVAHEDLIGRQLARLNQRHIKDMTIDEIRELTNALRTLENDIRTQNQLIAAQDNADVFEAGVQIMRDIENSFGTKKGLQRDLDNLIVQRTLSPVRFAHRLTGYVESDPLYQAVVGEDGLAGGQRKMLTYQYQAGQLFQEWLSDKQFMKWVTGKKSEILTYDITTADGKHEQIQLTPGMRMLLHLASKDQGWLMHMCGTDTMNGHRDGGGITLPNIKDYRNGKITDAYDDAKTVKITRSFLNKLSEDMTEKERRFADAISEYFNKMSKNAINEVSELLLGRSIAEVGDYLPISVDKNFLGKEYGAIKYDGTIEGMGNLKERQNSKKPVMIRDITDVLKQSIESTSKYVGLAIPIRNFNKLMGVTVGHYDADGNYRNFEGSVLQQISKKWGTKAQTYIENMISDLQMPNVSQDDLEKTFAKLRSHYAGAVLVWNLSVAMKQAASYPTAAAVLGGKALARAMVDFGKVDLDLIAKYTPLQWYRTKGFSTTELGDIQNQNNFFANLPKGLNWIQGVDVITTRKLWKAAEYYVQENNPELYKKGAGAKGQSDAYYQAVAEIYNQVIEETQPNYTALQRPDYLRSKSGITQTLMMFKTQPMQNFNILYDAVGNFRAKRAQFLNDQTNTEAQKAYQAAKTKLRRSIISQFAQLITFAGMTMLWNMIRRKKEKYTDEEGNFSLEVMAQNMGKDVGSGVFGMLPFGADVWSLVSSIAFGDKYYGFESVTDSALGDLGNAVMKAWSLGETMLESIKSGEPFDLTAQKKNLKSVAFAISKIAGIPLENVWNLGTAAYKRLGRDIWEDPYHADYWAIAWDDDPSSKKKDISNILYKAFMAGDMESYEDLRQILIDSGEWGSDSKSAEEDIDSNVQKRWIENTSGGSKAQDVYDYLHSLEGTDEFQTAYDQALAFGFTEAKLNEGIKKSFAAELIGANSSDFQNADLYDYMYSIYGTPEYQGYYDRLVEYGFKGSDIDDGVKKSYGQQLTGITEDYKSADLYDYLLNLKSSDSTAYNESMTEMKRIGFSDDEIKNGMKKSYGMELTGLGSDEYNVAALYDSLFDLRKSNKASYDTEVKAMKNVGFSQEDINTGIQQAYGRDMTGITEDLTMSDVYSYVYDHNLSNLGPKISEMKTYGFTEDGIKGGLKSAYIAGYGVTKTEDVYPFLYDLYTSNSSKFATEYQKMLNVGFTEKAIKDGIERLMKQAEGVDNVKKLSHRFAAPDHLLPSWWTYKSDDKDTGPMKEEGYASGSSWISNVSYNNGELTVYEHGIPYTYHGVSEEAYENFKAGGYRGKALNAYIKGKYSYN